LDAHLIAIFFDVNRPAIVKRVQNIYRTVELRKTSTCSILDKLLLMAKSKKGKFNKKHPIPSMSNATPEKLFGEGLFYQRKTLAEIYRPN
jgi:hypothetical protein